MIHSILRDNGNFYLFWYKVRLFYIWGKKIKEQNHNTIQINSAAGCPKHIRKGIITWDENGFSH